MAPSSSSQTVLQSLSIARTTYPAPRKTTKCCGESEIQVGRPRSSFGCTHKGAYTHHCLGGSVLAFPRLYPVGGFYKLAITTTNRIRVNCLVWLYTTPVNGLHPERNGTEIRM